MSRLASPSHFFIYRGRYGFPLDLSIQAFFEALLLFSTVVNNASHLRQINLVCFDQDTATSAIVLTQSLLDGQAKEAVISAQDRYLIKTPLIQSTSQ